MARIRVYYYCILQAFFFSVLEGKAWGQTPLVEHSASSRRCRAATAFNRRMLGAVKGEGPRSRGHGDARRKGVGASAARLEDTP